MVDVLHSCGRMLLEPVIAGREQELSSTFNYGNYIVDESRAREDDVLEGAFRIPHDAPPRWLLVLTAYIDESGQEQDDWMFLAGYLGDEAAWRRVKDEWGVAIAPRSHLHIRNLRFKRDSEREMLRRAAAVPERCGLKPVFGGVRQRDYADLILGSQDEKQLCGYVLCACALVRKAAITLPPGERVELVFERQDRHYPKVDLALGEIAKLNIPQMMLADGRSKIASWRSSEKTATSLLEPADYFAYALLQAWRDKNSLKATWCRPILDAFGQEGYGDILTREMVRSVVGDTLVGVSIGRAIKAWRDLT